MRRGQVSLVVLIFSAITVIAMSGFAVWAASFMNLSLRDLHREQAFRIAEAGIEYYRWHLAHAATDYQDGTGHAGPYVHPYYDKDGDQIGSFTLTVTPPPVGSTIVTIESEGSLLANDSVSKIIRVRMGIPSLARYATAANDDMRFGAGTEVFGEIISNKGIRFDGFAHNLIQSALTTYNDPDHTGGDEWAVHTHVSPTDPLPQTPLPTRSDVFLAGRAVGVPAVNFTGISQDLSNLRALATSSGVYATSSGVSGFELVLNTTSSYSIYKVNSLTAAPRRCSDDLGQSGWGTWSVGSRTLWKTGMIPASGIFFFEDNLWVRGQVSSTRVTIASGRFPDNPSTRTSITVNDNLLYSHYDGTDSIGLIAQKDINVGMTSLDTLRIDAALVAQNGRVGRYYYSSNCSPYDTRTAITSYGMIASNVRYGFAYTDGTGYDTRNLIYDSNFLYGPPPSFPLAGSQYSQISWEEVQ